MVEGAGNIIGGGWRCCVQADIVSQNATQAVIGVHIIYRRTDPSRWVASDAVSGGAWVNGVSTSTNTVNFGYRSFNGDVDLHTQQVTVTKQESAQTFSCRAFLNIPYGLPGRSEAHVNLTVPGITYAKPNPPKNVSWTRVNDSSVKAAWQSNYDNAARKYWKQIYADQCVGLNGGTQGAWGLVKALNWDALNYSYTGLKANARYQFRVAAQNPGGVSDHVYSGYIYTTPAAPVAVNAVKLSEQSVRVTVDASKSYVHGIRLRRRVNGGEWADITGGTPGATAEGWLPDINGIQNVTWTDTAAPAGQVQYAALVGRPVYGDDNSKTTLFSDWTYSNTIQTAVAPSAPTILNPTQNGAYVVNQPMTVAWKPNHPDGSAQSAAQVEVTDPSDVTVIEEQTTNTSYQRTPKSCGSYRIRVRTKGIHADWGAWSNYVTFTVAKYPNISINKPSGTITATPFTVAWTVADDTGVSSQTLIIQSDGVEKYRKTMDGSTRSLSIGASQYLPNNNSTLTITLVVRGGSGLESSTSVVRDVDWPDPAEPMAAIKSNNDYAALVIVSFGVPEEGQSETVSASVIRVMPDGSEVLIASNLLDQQLAVDPIPPLNTDFHYRVVAYSAMGTTIARMVDARIESGFGVLNFGTDAGQTLLLGYNNTVSHKRSHSTSEFHFARGDGANALPSSYELDQLDSTVSVTGVWEWDQALWLRILSLADGYPYAWYREPSGLRVYVKAEQSVSVDIADKKNISYSADLTQLTWEEPVL